MGVPHDYGFPGLNKEKNGLVSIPVEERHGLIWAILSPGREINVKAHLGEIDQEIGEFDFKNHFSFKPATIHKKYNWKFTADIFLEAYHVYTAHAKTIKAIFLDNVGLYDSFFPHQRNLFAKRSLLTLKDEDRANWNLRQHNNILYVIFPNTMLLIEPDHANVVTAFPRGTDETIMYAMNLVNSDPENDYNKLYWSKNTDILYNAIEEDFDMAESMQSGVKTGVNKVMHFGRFENSLNTFHSNIEKFLSKK